METPISDSGLVLILNPRRVIWCRESEKSLPTSEYLLSLFPTPGRYWRLAHTSSPRGRRCNRQRTCRMWSSLVQDPAVRGRDSRRSVGSESLIFDALRTIGRRAHDRLRSHRAHSQYGAGDFSGCHAEDLVAG